MTGTLKVERHGDHGRAVILIPGLQGGPWVWQRTIEQLQKDHVVYAVTLAGFDGMPAPADGGELFDRADASLEQLIEQRKIDRPVLVGHSLGGTLALRFAGEHPELISGVVAVDGLPIFPGMERVGAEQRKAMAAQMQQQMSAATPEQFQAQSLGYMQKIGVIDPQLAARYAPMNARSDIKASAQYMAEDLAFDGRAALKNANVPILEISPYNAPDFSQPPMMMSEAQKTAYYQSLLADAPKAKVVSISPSRHFVMLDQPARFQQALGAFLQSL
ncbi:alpha/beta hydrolase [Rhodanobacter sp. IGA1.0]|uniref:Alpha/beta hydrolase n=1 Tax=Rhodanobacter sp. IGA1.0 TaxID=3158582 RepID=A0AAU7QKC4_9GAMM